MIWDIYQLSMFLHGENIPLKKKLKAVMLNTSGSHLRNDVISVFLFNTSSSATTIHWCKIMLFYRINHNHFYFYYLKL